MTSVSGEQGPRAGRVSYSVREEGDMEIIDALMTEAEASEFLSVSAAALRSWRAAGNRGPAFLKMGRLVRYRQSDLQRFMEASRVLPEASA